LKTLRIKLINEEYEEVLEAIEKGNPDEVLKELCDLVYVCVGFAVTYGWSCDTAFSRVHDSNMSKLGKKGKPIYREDGKVFKSSMYIPPQLKDLV
jgi:NTP pyrophosphatase (non-canonical NTP hydrolase)